MRRRPGGAADVSCVAQGPVCGLAAFFASITSRNAKKRALRYGRSGAGDLPSGKAATLDPRALRYSRTGHGRRWGPTLCGAGTAATGNDLLQSKTRNPESKINNSPALPPGQIPAPTADTSAPAAPRRACHPARTGRAGRLPAASSAPCIPRSDRRSARRGAGTA